MTSITLTVTGAKARASVNGILTSGMVGIPVTIRYDDIWNGLTKNLVCRCGQWAPDRGETRTVLDVADTATVAQEVMQADMHLYLGVEGYSADGKLVIPTTWADCGMIQHGANAGADPSSEPSLSVWAQLQSRLGQLEDYLAENPVQAGRFSQKLRVALYNLLMDAVYQSAWHEEDKSALEELLTGGSTEPDEPDDPELVYYTIKKALTNVTISNGVATVQAGTAYSATLTAEEGYTLSKVTVTMGGTAVPVIDGLIDIASVTGNIVITATAEAETVGGYEWESGVPYDLTDKVMEGVELRTGYGSEFTNEKFVTTDYLNCFDAAGIYLGAPLAGVFFYDVNKNYISDAYVNATPGIKAVPGGAVYVRLTCQSQYWNSQKVVPFGKTTETYTPGVQNTVWEIGGLDAATGGDVSASSGVRTDFICVSGAKCLYASGSVSLPVVCMYDMNKKFICSGSGATEPVDLTAKWPGISFIRVQVSAIKSITLDDSTVYQVTRSVTNVSCSHACDACSREEYKLELTAKTGYTLEGAPVTVTMGGVDITETAYNAADGTITIENVTGNIVIKASAVAVTE